MTTPSLPQTRPMSDTYGPDLTNERPVSRPDYELDAAAWNQAKADIAAACQQAMNAAIYVANSGGAWGVDDSSIAGVMVTRLSTGYVKVTMPAGLVPRMAFATARGGLGIFPVVESMSGQDIFVRAYFSSTGAYNDSAFGLLVF